MSRQQSLQARDFFRSHGAKHVMICNGSGTGETLGCSTNAMGAKYRPETVGQLMLGPHYLVMNEDFEEAKYREKGEL